MLPRPQASQMSADGSSPRVILTIGNLDCGGAQRVLVDMANHWAELGWNVTLATWTGGGAPYFYDMNPRITVVSLNQASARASLTSFVLLKSLVIRMLNLRRLVAEQKPDAVLSFIDVSNILTITSMAVLGVRVVVSERTNPCENNTISGVWKFLRRLSYRRAAAVVAQTDDAAQWLDKQCRIQSLVIPNAIRRMRKVDAVRIPLILAIGRLSPEKGIDTLLRAFALISNKFNEWRLVIAGDGPEQATLIGLREELHLIHQVDFVGEVRDVEEWLARAGLVVHASRREGFPNVVLEAMAMGAPVVCTNCRSGPSDIIRDRVNGRLIPVDDIRALADAMAELIENPELRLQLATEALKVRQSYEQNVIMNRWTAVLLGRRAASHNPCAEKLG
jgi:GalNAc-alpha-(1->4)-GalNAc-alpha-(1->3)-diNAcBac-PP-undecaprenol alpha-1,4-N-acetyl-D-galactosaminyltransferase